MKIKPTWARCLASLLGLLAVLLGSSAYAQSTAFTYQGRLVDGGAPAHGSYDLTFTIFDAASGPAQVSGTLTNFATPVSGGAFTVTLDFGNMFPGAARWLEISVTTNGGGSFATLAPRQPFTATPYAIHSVIAENAFNAATAGTASNLLGTLPAGQLAGAYTNALTLNNPGNSFSGDGSGLTGINAWRLAGNAGTTPAANFLGTTDDQPLELRVNNDRALRLEPSQNGTPNLIGGSFLNAITTGTGGATIAGGHANDIGAGSSFTAIGGGYDSHIMDGANYATIAGGRGNYVFADGQYSTVSGGYQNQIAASAEAATIAGGIGGDIGASSSYSAVGGGFDNNIASSAAASTIAGGRGNVISKNSGASTVSGGENNRIADTSPHATIAGGIYGNIGTNSSFSAVGGGYDNRIADYSPNATIAGGAVQYIGNYSDGGTIGGGGNNRIEGLSSGNTIAGGYDNQIDSFTRASVISGGESHYIAVSSAHATIAGGHDNGIGAVSDASTISGGYQNAVGTNSSLSTVGGGSQNIIRNNSAKAVIAGGLANVIFTNSAASAISGGEFNHIGAAAPWATIAGGYVNDIGINSSGSTIGGGEQNRVGFFSTVATIAGGVYNEIHSQSSASVIGGGLGNIIDDNSDEATIGGGYLNNILSNSPYSTISGGNQNVIQTNAPYATIPGGLGNTAANYAFAAGRFASATNSGAFVWSDSTGTATGSTASNSVTFRASGGYRFLTGTNTAGAQLAAGATAWSVMSDRDAKKNFAAVDYESVLDKLSRVPVSQWNYQWENDSAVPNIGPMAQDFKAAFFPGRDDKTISTLEFDGVELAAIQGLNRKLEQKQTEITELKARLEKLERLVNEKIGGGK